MASFDELARIAEIELCDIVDSTESMGTKLRIMLIRNTDLTTELPAMSQGKNVVSGTLRFFMEEMAL